MALGWFDHLADGRPAPLRRLRTRRPLNPVAVAAMAEVGIDIADRTPSDGPRTTSAPPTSSSRWAAATPAPYVPGTRYEDWALDDPAGQGLDAVRPIRDEIRSRVQQLLDDLA